MDTIPYLPMTENQLKIWPSMHIPCFSSLENNYFYNMIVYCFTQQNVLGIMLPKNVPADLIFIKRYLNDEIVFFPVEL